MRDLESEELLQQMPSLQQLLLILWNVGQVICYILLASISFHSIEVFFTCFSAASECSRWQLFDATRIGIGTYREFQYLFFFERQKRVSISTVLLTYGGHDLCD